MAATLPALNTGPLKASQTVQQHYVPTPPTSKPTSASAAALAKKIKHAQSKKEKEMLMKQQILRAQQPDLNKRDAAQYRNSYKHNLCLDMLQQGFHKSFAELFALMNQQQQERLCAGPESILWNQVLLENEPEKLSMLKEKLTMAEAALRQEDAAAVYKAQFELAKFFQNSDKWLADHFFAECLTTSAAVKTDGGRMAADAHRNVGLAQEESGDYFVAVEHFEQFYKLTKDKDEWVTQDGDLVHTEACQHLCRIYNMVGNNYEASNDTEQSIVYLVKAYEMAKEAKNKQLEGEASYRLGIAYENNQDSETALTYLTQYLERCRDTGDHTGIGKACESIARSYQSQGKVEDSIRYLDMFVDVAEQSKDDKALSKACSSLGAIYNSLGKYDKASEFFSRAYQISRTLNDAEAISSSRVLFGVAAAHKMLGHVAVHVNLGQRPCLERLIEWKDNRGDEFEKPIPGPKPEEKEEKAEDVKEDEKKEKPAEAEETPDSNNNNSQESAESSQEATQTSEDAPQEPAQDQE